MAAEFAVYTAYSVCIDSGSGKGVGLGKFGVCSNVWRPPTRMEGSHRKRVTKQSDSNVARRLRYLVHSSMELQPDSTWFLFLKNIERDKLKTVEMIKPFMDKVIDELKLNVVGECSQQYKKIM